MNESGRITHAMTVAGRLVRADLTRASWDVFATTDQAVDQSDEVAFDDLAAVLGRFR